jgi:hypothetical protein
VRSSSKSGASSTGSNARTGTRVPGSRDQSAQRGLALHDLRQCLRVLVAARQIRGEQLDRPGERGEWVADLVGKPGRELADRSEPLAPSQLLLHLDHACQILEDDDRAVRSSPRIAQHRDRHSQV